MYNSSPLKIYLPEKTLERGRKQARCNFSKISRPLKKRKKKSKCRESSKHTREGFGSSIIIIQRRMHISLVASGLAFQFSTYVIIIFPFFFPLLISFFFAREMVKELILYNALPKSFYLLLVRM